MNDVGLRAVLWLVRLVGGLAVAAGGCAGIVGAFALWSGDGAGVALPLAAVLAGAAVAAAGFYADVRVTAAERRLNARRPRTEPRGFDVVVTPADPPPR